MSMFEQFKKAAPAITLAGLVACSPNKAKKPSTLAQDTNVVGEPTVNLVEAQITNNSGVVKVAVTNWDAAIGAVKTNKTLPVAGGIGRSKDNLDGSTPLNTTFAGKKFGGELPTKVMVGGKEYPIIDCTKENEIRLAKMKPENEIAFKQFSTVVLDAAHQAPTEPVRMRWETLLSKSGRNVICNQASFKNVPDYVDVIFIMQTSAPYGFLPEELSGLTDFVKKGGSLVLVASEKSFAAQQVAKSFGIEADPGKKYYVPFSLVKDYCQEGKSSPAINIIGNGYRKDGAKPVLVDKGGQAAGICVQDSSTGKGKVICLPMLKDTRIVLDSTICGLMSAAGSQGKTPSKVSSGKISDFFADRKVLIGNEEFHFPSPTVVGINNLIENFSQIKPYVEDWMRQGSRGDKKYIFLSPCIEQGSGGNTDVWLPIGGTMESFKIITIHELTHMCSAALQENFEEALAYKTEHELGKTICPEEAEISRAYWHSMMERAKSDKSINLSGFTNPEIKLGYGRAMWIIKQWEAAFGDDFMPQVVAAARCLKNGTIPLTTPEVVYVANMVASDMKGVNVTINGMPFSVWCQSVNLPKAEKPKKSETDFTKALQAARASRDSNKTKDTHKLASGQNKSASAR